MVGKSPWKPKRHVRRHLYYKVQVYDDRSKVWRDQKPAFDSLDAARSYIASSLTGGVMVRIMSIDGRERRPIPAN